MKFGRRFESFLNTDEDEAVMSNVKRYKIGKDFYIRSASGSLRNADQIRSSVRRDGEWARKQARKDMERSTRDSQNSDGQ